MDDKAGSCRTGFPWRPVASGLAMLAGLGLAGWAIRAAGLDAALSQGWIDDRVRGHGAAGLGVFLAAAAGLSAVGLPRQVFCFLGGYAFGFWAGTLWAALGSLLGCALSLGYARFLGRSLVMGILDRRKGRLGIRLARLETLLRREPFAMTLVVRLSPVGNNLLTNLLAGALAIPALPFLAGSLAGQLPQTMVFALLGSGVQVNGGWRVALSAVLLVASTALGYRIYCRSRLAAD